MIRFFKSLFPTTFKRSVKEHLGVPSLHWSLQNIKKKGFNPTHVVDIGAYEGEWTKNFLEVFPTATVLMVEAQASKKEALQLVQQQHPSVQIDINILSAENDVAVAFYENETASHVNLKGTTTDAHNRMVTTKTLDTLLNQQSFPLPQFLKLDVQGHEIAVLKGGLKALQGCTFCLLEVSLLQLSDSEPLFFEVQQYMDANNFQVYDICQFMRRPYDKALYQMDVLFIKKNHAFINDRNW